MISIDGQNSGRDDNGNGWKNWFAGALCFAGLMAGTVAAEAQTRTLKLMNVHTGEKAEVTYRRGSSYDSAGLKKANYILRDWRKNQPIRMNPKALDVLWEVYRNTGASGYIHVICGYRSPATNSMLRSRSRGVAKKSQHMIGNAIDFYIPGIKLKTLRNAGLALQAGGVGYYPSSGSPFVHMDVGRVRTWGPTSPAEVAAAIKSGKRFSSGGGSVVAFAGDDSGSGRSRGLLARLFGGGADEEEDNAEIESPKATVKPPKIVAKPAPQVEETEIAEPKIKIVPPELANPAEIPAAPEQQPEEVVETPETIIAALPSRKVPMPLFAPRPQVDVGQPEEPAQVAALIENPETALPVEAAGGVSSSEAVSVVPEEKPIEVALNVPLPTWRPDYRGSTTEETDASALLALASASTSDTASDAFSVVPTQRPDAMAGTTTAEMTGAIPLHTTAKQTRVAAQTPVKTTQKAARPSRSDGKPDRKPVVVAAQPQDARWAIDKTYVTKASAGTKAPSYAYNIVRTAPLEVYTAGFQQGEGQSDINRFTGKAVKFLQVARFETK